MPKTSEAVQKEKIITKEISNAVSSNKIHSSQIILRYSQLRDLPENEKNGEKVLYRIEPHIDGKNLFLELHLKVMNITCDEPFFGQILIFGLVGHFVADDDVSEESLEEFAKKFTLALLWPYAREYVQSTFQRTGQVNTILPILNAQEATHALLKRGDIVVIKE